MDFVASSDQQLVIGPNMDSNVVSIEILNDNLKEVNESFTVSLSTTVPRVQIKNEPGLVVITDDDSEFSYCMLLALIA